MPSIDRPGADQEDGEQLPEQAETVIWAAEGGFNLGNVGDYPEDCFSDDLDLSPVPARIEGETLPTIHYEFGEELPLPVAKDQWPDWHDRMIAIDGNGRRVDSTSSSSLNLEALERWRMQNPQL